MKFIRLFFIICLIQCCAASVHAQTTDTLSNYSNVDTLVEDTATGTVAPATNNNIDTAATSEGKYIRYYVDENKLEGLRKKNAFQYSDIENDSLQLEQFKSKPKRREVELPKFDGSVLLWIILVIAAIAVILQFTGISFRQIFSPSSLKQNEEAEDINENIHSISFNEAIKKAIADKNYSLAIRFMYLRNLKILSDKQLIKWNETKTNWQYVFELNGTPLQKDFRATTSVFEYVQYGKVEIKEDKFLQLQNLFNDFKQSIG